MPSDDIPLRVLVLLLELLKSGELPELAVGGAWFCVNTLMLRGSAALGTLALEADICGLAGAGLRAVGSAADWVVSIVSSLALAIIRGVAPAELTGLRRCGSRASHAATQARLTP